MARNRCGAQLNTLHILCNVYVFFRTPVCSAYGRAYGRTYCVRAYPIWALGKFFPASGLKLLAHQRASFFFRRKKGFSQIKLQNTNMADTLFFLSGFEFVDYGCLYLSKPIRRLSTVFVDVLSADPSTEWFIDGCYVGKFIGQTQYVYMSGDYIDFEFRYGVQYLCSAHEFVKAGPTQFDYVRRLRDLYEKNVAYVPFFVGLIYYDEDVFDSHFRINYAVVCREHPYYNDHRYLSHMEAVASRVMIPSNYHLAKVTEDVDFADMHCRTPKEFRNLAVVYNGRSARTTFPLNLCEILAMQHPGPAESIHGDSPLSCYTFKFRRTNDDDWYMMNYEEVAMLSLIDTNYNDVGNPMGLFFKCYQNIRIGFASFYWMYSEKFDRLVNPPSTLSSGIAAAFKGDKCTYQHYVECGSPVFRQWR